MGLENMRRWPMYIVFGICILLILSLFNSWSSETEVRKRFSEISKQLYECNKQQTSCMEESLSFLEQRDSYVSKANDLEKQKTKLSDDLSELKIKFIKSDSQVNRTLVDVELCKTELQSLKNLEVSQTATLDTLRFEKKTLSSQLDEKKKHIEVLEKEVEKLKSALASKSTSNSLVALKVTPAAPSHNQSPSLLAHDQINENNAREDFEDVNALNDNTDFDQQMQ